MKKIVIINSIIIVIVVIGGYWLWQSGRKGSETPVNQDQTQQASGQQQGATTAYTMNEVAQHNNQTSCWTVIRGRVYDLTLWIGQHPGGPGAILGLCGKDGTQAFVNQHGGMQQQEQVLATFNIGTLKQ